MYQLLAGTSSDRGSTVDGLHTLRRDSTRKQLCESFPVIYNLYILCLLTPHVVSQKSISARTHRIISTDNMCTPFRQTLFDLADSLSVLILSVLASTTMPQHQQLLLYVTPSSSTFKSHANPTTPQDYLRSRTSRGG